MLEDTANLKREQVQSDVKNEKIDSFVKEIIEISKLEIPSVHEKVKVAELNTPKVTKSMRNESPEFRQRIQGISTPNKKLGGILKYCSTVKKEKKSGLYLV